MLLTTIAGFPLFLVITDVLTAVLVIGAIALVMGLAITLVSRLFAVEEDTRALEIAEILPNVNCGGCGYSGCQGYATALASGEDKLLDKCTAGGQETADGLAAYFGKEPSAYVPKMAIVHCQGSQHRVLVNYQYSGSRDCRTAGKLFGGPGSCSYGCLGFGDCLRACKYGAISINDGLAKVDPQKCIACGACVRACPRKLIRIEPKYSDLYTVRCMNPETGAKVRQVCGIGCIGCTLCEKNCPAEAIHMEEHRAVIDVEKCQHCDRCFEVCPSKSVYMGL